MPTGVYAAYFWEKGQQLKESPPGGATMFVVETGKHVEREREKEGGRGGGELVSKAPSQMDCISGCVP